MSASECHLILPNRRPKTKALFYNISKGFPRKTAYSLSYIRIESFQCWLKNSIAKNLNGWKHIHFTDLRLVNFNLGIIISCGSNHVFIKCSAVRRPPSIVRRPPSVRLLSTPFNEHAFNWYNIWAYACTVLAFHTGFFPEQNYRVFKSKIYKELLTENEVKYAKKCSSCFWINLNFLTFFLNLKCCPIYTYESLKNIMAMVYSEIHACIH
jgi:hypothetical protein